MVIFRDFWKYFTYLWKDFKLRFISYLYMKDDAFSCLQVPYVPYVPSSAFKCALCWILASVLPGYEALYMNVALLAGFLDLLCCPCPCSAALWALCCFAALLGFVFVDLLCCAVACCCAPVNLNLATPFRLAWARLACSNRSGKMFLELDGILRGGNGSVCNMEGDAAT